MEKLVSANANSSESSEKAKRIPVASQSDSFHKYGLKKGLIRSWNGR